MDHPHPQCAYITLQELIDHKAKRSTLKTKREIKMHDAELSKHFIDNAFMDDDLPLVGRLSRLSCLACKPDSPESVGYAPRNLYRAAAAAT